MSCTESFVKILRERGYRITPQRVLILETVSHGPGHMTVEKIHQQVQSIASPVNLATVYRTLEMLVAEGLATRTESANGTMVYSPLRHGDHLHLICKLCGKTISVEGHFFTNLKKQIEEEYDFHPDLNHITLFGTCKEHQREPVVPPNISSD